MIGFVGSRRIIDLKNGLLHQRIVCSTPEEKAFWLEVFPPDTDPVVGWAGEMILALGPKRHQVICQSVKERDQWRKTFRIEPNSLFKVFARWSSESVLVGSEPKAARPASPADSADQGEEEPAAEAPVLEDLSDPQLRTMLAERGITVKKGTPRADLIEKLQAEITKGAAIQE